MPSLITTLGGNIAAVCSRCQSLHNYEFATHKMLEQSERHPLVFALSLHGFIVGQPYRLRPVRQAIKHCVEHKDNDRVWFTRAGDIAKYCFTLPKGVIPGG